MNAERVFRLLATSPLLSSVIKVTVVSSDFHIPRAMCMFEAVQAHGEASHGFHGDLTAIYARTPAPEPDRAATSSSSSSSSSSTSSVVNGMTHRQRLAQEALLISTRLDAFLAYHLPGVPMPPLPPARVARAMAEVQAMLDENDDSPAAAADATKNDANETGLSVTAVAPFPVVAVINDPMKIRGGEGVHVLLVPPALSAPNLAQRLALASLQAAGLVGEAPVEAAAAVAAVEKETVVAAATMGGSDVNEEQGECKEERGENKEGKDNQEAIHSTTLSPTIKADEVRPGGSSQGGSRTMSGQGPPLGGLFAAIKAAPKSISLRKVETHVRQLGCVDGGRSAAGGAARGGGVGSGGGRGGAQSSVWAEYAGLVLGATGGSRKGQGDEVEDAYAAFGRAAGINEWVMPRTGDGLVTLPVTGAPQWSRSVVCSCKSRLCGCCKALYPYIIHHSVVPTNPPT